MSRATQKPQPGQMLADKVARFNAEFERLCRKYNLRVDTQIVLTEQAVKILTSLIHAKPVVIPQSPEAAQK